LNWFVISISRARADSPVAFGTAHDSPFDAIGTSEHAPRQIHPTLLQQLANATRADASSAQTQLRHLVSKKAETLTDNSQEADITLAAMTEGKAAAEVDLFRVQPIGNYRPQEITRANLGEVLIKANDYGLFDSQHAQRLYLLIEGLEERRRRFRMEQCARVRVERDHRWHGARRPSPLNNRFHDELMPEMQAVEHAQG